MDLAEFKRTYMSQLNGLPESRIANVHRKIRGISNADAILNAIAIGQSSYAAEKQKNKRHPTTKSVATEKVNAPSPEPNLQATNHVPEPISHTPSPQAPAETKKEPTLSIQKEIDPNEVRRAIAIQSTQNVQTKAPAPLIQKAATQEVAKSIQSFTKNVVDDSFQMKMGEKSFPEPTKYDLERLWRRCYDAKCAMARVRPESLKLALYDKYMEICDDVMKTMNPGPRSDECIIAKCGQMYITVDDLFELYEQGSRRHDIIDTLRTLRF